MSGATKSTERLMGSVQKKLKYAGRSGSKIALRHGRGRALLFQDEFLTGFQDKPAGALELLSPFTVEKGAGGHMVGDGVAGTDQLSAGTGLLQVHVKAAVTDEKRIMDIPLGQFAHLLCCRGVACGIDGNASWQGDQPSYADRDIMIFVVAGLYRLDYGIPQIIPAVDPVLQSLGIGNDLALCSAVLDEFHGIVIPVAMGDQDEVCGKVVAFPCIRIDIDDLAI